MDAIEKGAPKYQMRIYVEMSGSAWDRRAHRAKYGSDTENTDHRQECRAHAGNENRVSGEMGHTVFVAAAQILRDRC